MAVFIDETRENRVRELLEERAKQGRKKMSFREIARRAGVAKGTVQRIFLGREARRKTDDEEPEDESKLPFSPVADYVCRPCSEWVGRPVVSSSVPCLACQARALRFTRRCVSSQGGH